MARLSLAGRVRLLALQHGFETLADLAREMGMPKETLYSATKRNSKHSGARARIENFFGQKIFGETDAAQSPQTK